MAIYQQKAIFNLRLFNHRLPKKVKPKDQAIFLSTLYELLEEGFSLNQALVFMELLMPNYQLLIREIVNHLEQGHGLETGLRSIGYSLNIVSQLFYAQKQGRLYPALNKSAKYLKTQFDYRNQIVKTLAYPIMMLGFLLSLLFGMRAFLLPHIVSFISQEVYASNLLIRLLIRFFSYLPQILTGLIGVSLLIILFFDYYLLKKSYLIRINFLLKIPLIKKWVRWYCTYKIAQSLGHFIEGGFSLQQTIDFIITYPIDPFLNEIAVELNDSLLSGNDLSSSLDQLGIFQSELGMIVHQGELTSQLATKCIMYAEKLLLEMMEDIAKKIGYLQPILFITIAVLVMSMYLLIMLPMLTMEII